MSGILGEAGEELATGFLEEVFDEMSGRSTAKWGIALVAFVAGAAVVLAIAGRRRRKAGAPAAQAEPDHLAG